MLNNNAVAEPLSEGKRLQYINDDRKLKRLFHQFTFEERRFILDGMALGVNREWIEALIEDAKAMRQNKGLIP